MKIKILIFSAAIIICFAFQESPQSKPISYSKVITVDSIGKTELFSNIKTWFATTYNSSTDVIQMQDQESGTIVGKALFQYSYGTMFYECFKGKIEYTITVTVKDNRYKVELTGFNHSVNYGNGPQCSLGLIAEDPIYSESYKVPFGNSKKQFNNTWNDIQSKSKAYADNIISSLEQHTLNIEVEEEW